MMQSESRETKWQCCCKSMYKVGGGDDGSCRQANENIAEHCVCRHTSVER